MTVRLYLSFPDCRRDNKRPLSSVKLAEPVDAVVDDPFFVPGAGFGENRVDDYVDETPVHMVQIPALGKELLERRDALDETDLRGGAAAELKPGHANAQDRQPCADVRKPGMVPILQGDRAPREKLAKRRLQESQHQGYAGQDDEGTTHGPIESARCFFPVMGRLFPDLSPRE